MNDYKYTAFGNRLKMLREQCNIKQGQFADKIGITRQSMSNYESGKHCPDIEVLKKMADSLECSVDYLLGLTEHSTAEKKEEFHESLYRLDEILCTIPEPVRIAWIDLFTETARQIEKDLNGSVQFHQSAITIFNSMISLMNCCSTATVNYENEIYTKQVAQKYNKIRFETMLQLRNLLNRLDNDSYNCINRALETNTKETLSPKHQETLNHLEESLDTLLTPKGDE